MRNQVTASRWADIAKRSAPKQMRSRKSRVAGDSVKVYDDDDDDDEEEEVGVDFVG